MLYSFGLLKIGKAIADQQEKSFRTERYFGSHAAELRRTRIVRVLKNMPDNRQTL